MSGSFSRPGAVDLSKLAGAPAPAAGQAPGQGGAAGSGSGPAGRFVIDVTEETFQSEVAERSLRVPVIVDFWADWCQPCKQLSPILERLSDAYEGRFVLAKVDVEANPRIAQAAGAQSIPLVIAVIRGQVVPLFQGAIPEAQAREAIEQVLQVATANGVAGRSEPLSEGREGEFDSEPVRDPRYADADAALQTGDLDGAIRAFEKLLEQTPGDAEAKQGLARVKLLSRTAGANAREVREAAAADPASVDAQRAAADVDVSGGHVKDAFDRLLDVIRRTSGDERDAVRLHLLELFEAVGADDPRVGVARRQLSAALF